ncbi:hypothetical protein KAI87_07665, partial [Myxococcota bacterium]|nr:hypothetical protein [Myxococcota bacterium]
DFRTPAPDGIMSATGAWIQGLSSTAAKPTQDLPLDMAVSYPTQLTNDYPVLKAGGNVVTRLESEFKGVADKASMTKAISRMYKMAGQAAAGDNSEIQKLLGKDWTVSTVNRYWLKDDGSNNSEGKAGTGFFKGFRVDDDNLPIQDPMLDHYMDDADLSLTRAEGALRLRSNKAATVINIKPGGGVIDPKTGIRQRVEVGLELIPEATLDEARDVLDGLNENSRWSGTIFNHAAHEIEKLDGNIDLANALVPWLELKQDRHKFTIKNEKTGVEIEISLDKVMAKTVRDVHANINGEARETTFYVMESELDHLQLASSNQAAYVGGSASVGIFETDDNQDDWLENISDTATMDVDPRLHELEDLKNKAFRNTSSYKSFEVANAIMTQELFPAGFAPAKQKAAQAAELLGLEPITADVAVSMVARTVVQSGLDWSPTLDNALRQLATTPARVEKILSELKLHEDNQDVGRLLQRLLGIATPPLKYDQDALFERVRKTLEPLGWGVGSDVKAFLAKLDASKVTPAFLFDELESAYYRSGSQIFGYIAAHQGIAPVILKFDVTSLRPSFDDACKNADIAKTDRQGIWDFIEKANAGGADQSQIQNAIQYLGNERTDYLIDLENAAGVPLPEIHVTGKQIYNKFLIHTSSFHLIPDTSLEKFWTDVAAKVELVDLETLIEDITYYGFTQSMQAAADAASIKAPKLNYDFAAIDASYKSSFDYGMIKYDAKTRDFLHKLLERGASPDSMESAVSDIDSMTLKEALERYDVDIPGRLTIPPTKWNVAKIVSELQNKYSYDWTKSVGKYVRETLKVAGKSHSFNYYDIYSRDLTDLLETLEYESGISIPDKVLKSLS